MHRINKISRHAQCRRFIYFFTFFLILFYIFIKLSRYYENSSYSFDSTKYAKQYNEYIDQNGTYLPYTGYEILQLVKRPIPSAFTELNIYLDLQNELKSYFQFVPEHAYHITLTSLQNKTYYDNNIVESLRKEQSVLDEIETETIGTGKQLLVLDKNQIRMEVELSNDQIKEYQKRWTEQFPKLIVQHHTSFYITLAYQYKNIPDKETYDLLERLVKEWQLFPIDIPLDPVEICIYHTVISYLPLLPEIEKR